MTLTFHPILILAGTALAFRALAFIYHRLLDFIYRRRVNAALNRLANIYAGKIKSRSLKLIRFRKTLLKSIKSVRTSLLPPER